MRGTSNASCRGETRPCDRYKRPTSFGGVISLSDDQRGRMLGTFSPAKRISPQCAGPPQHVCCERNAK